MASFRQMADAVHQLTELKRKHLVELEEMSYREGIAPGPDVSFAGVRICVARAAEAYQVLNRLAPYERELLAWYAERRRHDATIAQETVLGAAHAGVVGET